MDEVYREAGEHIVQLSFPVIGPAVPLDYAYPLFSAMAHSIPELHDMTRLRVGPLSQVLRTGALLKISGKTRLPLRVPALDLPVLLRLSDIKLVLASSGRRTYFLRLGSPLISTLNPTERLFSRAVFIKVSGVNTPDRHQFLSAAERQLRTLGIQGRLSIAGRIAPDGFDPARRMLRIRDQQVFGYQLELVDLGDEASLLVQSYGLGGRHHFGGGFFVPGNRTR